MLIANVVQDSPAAKAGIVAGDIVIEFDKKKVDTPQDLQKIVATAPPGKGVPVKVWRDKGEKTLEIQIGDTPEDNVALKSSNKGKGMLGLDVRPLTPELARQLKLQSAEGVLVFAVEDESAAAEAGMQRGDVIREVNRQRIRSVPDFERVVRDVKEGDRVTVLLQRGQQALYVAFTVGQGISHSEGGSAPFRFLPLASDGRCPPMRNPDCAGVAGARTRPPDAWPCLPSRAWRSLTSRESASGRFAIRLLHFV